MGATGGDPPDLDAVAESGNDPKVRRSGKLPNSVQFEIEVIPCWVGDQFGINLKAPGWQVTGFVHNNILDSGGTEETLNTRRDLLGFIQKLARQQTSPYRMKLTLEHIEP